MNGMRTLLRPVVTRSDDLLDGTEYGQMRALFEPEHRAPAIDHRFVERREGVARVAFRARSRKQLVFGALLLTGLVLVVIAKSGLFDVRAIGVSGASRVDADVVRRAAQLHGQPSMFTLDAESVAARVRELPWVKSASVERRWPNRVEIRVVEYTPAAVAVAGNEVALVASNNRVLARAALVPLGMPQITGITKLPNDGAQLLPANVAEVARLLPAPLRSALVSIDVADPSGVVVKLVDIDIRLGRLVDIDRKLRTAEAVLERGDSCREYIDVSVPSAPVAGCGNDIR